MTGKRRNGRGGRSRRKGSARKTSKKCQTMIHFLRVTNLQPYRTGLEKVHGRAGTVAQHIKLIPAAPPP